MKRHPHPRRTVAARQRVWKALRVLKAFDVPLLAAAAAVPESSAREFLGLLTRSQYVKITLHASGRPSQINQYRLLRDTGPRAPRRIFDFMRDENTGEMTALEPAKHTRRPNLGGGGDGRIIAKARRDWQRRAVV